MAAVHVRVGEFARELGFKSSTGASTMAPPTPRSEHPSIQRFIRDPMGLINKMFEVKLAQNATAGNRLDAAQHRTFFARDHSTPFAARSATVR